MTEKKTEESGISLKGDIPLRSEREALHHAILATRESLQGLFAQKSLWKIAELVQQVSLNNHFPWADDYLLAIYQKQFITQAALCRLSVDLLSRSPAQGFRLTPVTIVLESIDAPGLRAKGGDERELGEQACSLNDGFYLNDQNFFTATPDSVAKLMESFWQRYDALDGLSSAWAILELAGGESWGQVVAQYRRLVAHHHPDKGGDTENFVKIRQAFERLKRHFSSHQTT